MQHLVLLNIKNKFGDIRTVSVSLNEDVDVLCLNNFDGLVDYTKNESSLDIKFDANKIEIDNIINYIFSSLNKLCSA